MKTKMLNSYFPSFLGLDEKIDMERLLNSLRTISSVRPSPVERPPEFTRPSGASTDRNVGHLWLPVLFQKVQALELRDGEPKRLLGKGVLKVGAFGCNIKGSMLNQPWYTSIHINHSTYDDMICVVDTIGLLSF